MTNPINPANSGPGFYETSKYRCLVDARKQSDMLYLLLCGVESCMPDYEFRTGGREGYHLHVILSGKGVLCVNGTQTALHYGQMFITKPDENAWYRADRSDPWTYCWMAYGGSNALRYTEAAGFGSGVNWLNCGVHPSRFYAIVNRALEQPDLNLAGDLLHVGLLAEFLSLAIQSNISSEQAPRREAEYSADMYVDYAVNYINANYATARINNVASYIGIHRSCLTGIFKKKWASRPRSI